MGFIVWIVFFVLWVYEVIMQKKSGYQRDMNRMWLFQFGMWIGAIFQIIGVLLRVL